MRSTRRRLKSEFISTIYGINTNNFASIYDAYVHMWTKESRQYCTAQVLNNHDQRVEIECCQDQPLALFKRGGQTLVGCPKVNPTGELGKHITYALDPKADETYLRFLLEFGIGQNKAKDRCSYWDATNSRRKNCGKSPNIPYTPLFISIC
jgi:hypothetical protein